MKTALDDPRLNQWRAYFAAMSDRDLKSAWMTWGRESETEEINAAWLAVNEEMHGRDL